MRISTYHMYEPFHLEQEGVLPHVEVRYTTYGQLNENRTNALLVCHALTANAEAHVWWSGLFGEGKVLDPTRYFIICPNNLGSPYGTTSAKSINPDTGRRYGLSFPPYTIRDKANLHIALLNQLEIKGLACIIGGSCGGNICQEVAFMSTIPIEKMILLCCSAQETPWVIGIHEAQRVAMEIDPTLHDMSEEAGRKGMYASRAFALSFYRSHPSIKLRQSEDHVNILTGFKASSYIRYQGQKFVERYDPHCYYTQLLCLDTHHMGRGRSSAEQALSKILTPTLCIGFDTDLLIPVGEQQFLARHLPFGEFAEVKTLFGHDAFLIETDILNPLILEFI